MYVLYRYGTWQIGTSGCAAQQFLHVMVADEQSTQQEKFLSVDSLHSCSVTSMFLTHNALGAAWMQVAVSQPQLTHADLTPLA